MNLETFLKFGRKVIQKKLFKTGQQVYHWLLAFAAAVFYRFPSRKIFVLGIVGTKGKTTTAEIANAILEEAGHKTALSSSLRFKIGKNSETNKFKMTMPGRFFAQKFLRKVVDAKCRYAILELTSEGAVQHRHKFIILDALIFTNLSPEHIESHGSFEKYRDAKLKIFRALEKSPKRNKIIIANEDDPSAPLFLDFSVEKKIKYGLNGVRPYKVSENGVDFTLDGVSVYSKLSGEFNLYNILAAAAFAKSQGVKTETIKSAVEKFSGAEGRMEKIDEGQDFTVVVDYAHTPDSLKKVYETFAVKRKICVIGSAGGGRDKWKRPEMGGIASRYCERVILTNEDPYDDDPGRILLEIKSGISISEFPISNVYEILDRREAIAKALSLAKTGDAVIVTGKGAEPWMMGTKGTKIKWDDREVTREELKKI